MTAEANCILDFSALPVWFASCFAFKLQFLDVQDYINQVDLLDNETDKIIIKGSLLKRIVDWHNEICGVLTKKFVNDHTPKFVKGVIDNSTLTEPNDSGTNSDITMCDPFDLHVTLLMKASEMMISCLAKSELSGDAVAAIKNWFALFDQPEFDDFLQCSQKHVEWKEKISLQHSSFSFAIDSDTIGFGDLGQFFDPGTLFLYLAHVVFMECYDPSFVCLVENSKLEQTGGQNRSRQTLAWQKACGTLVKWRFKYDSFKGMTGKSPMKFPILSSLKPMSHEIENEIRKGKGQAAPPPVHNIHCLLLQKMYWLYDDKVQNTGIRINAREKVEFDVLDAMLDELKRRTEGQMGKLLGREKNFRNAIRNGRKGFRIDRDSNNDLFLMGDDSDSIANLIKRQKQKKEKKENREGLGNPF